MIMRRGNGRIDETSLDWRNIDKDYDVENKGHTFTMSYESMRRNENIHWVREWRMEGETRLERWILVKIAHFYLMNDLDLWDKREERRRLKDGNLDEGKSEERGEERGEEMQTVPMITVPFGWAMFSLRIVDSYLILRLEERN